MAATATRLVTCVLPPAAPTTAVRGGLALTAKEPARPASTLPAPTAARSTLKSSLLRASPLGLERTVADVWAMHIKATVTAVTTSWPTWCQVALGSPRAGRRASTAEHAHPVVRKATDTDQSRGHHHADQGTGDAVVHFLAHDHGGQYPGGDGQGPAVQVADLVDDGLGSADRRRASPGQAENGGQLFHQDLDAYTSEEPVDHRQGQEIGDPAQAQQPRPHQHRPTTRATALTRWA